jgi:prolyl-tRNA synthetase
MMAKWISSHRDLPLLLNQWANVVRWEMRPRVFLRTTEFLWQEGHTAHADGSAAMAETMLALDLYTEVARDVAALPVVPGEKTPGERFAGAVRTFTIEAMMRDGKALQAGTSHYMATNFANAFDIRYTSEAGRQELCHTTSWGMSTRMIGAIIMAHGDDQGLVLPPKLAPYQVVIVPIGRDEQLGPVLTAADALKRELKQQGIRAHVDVRTGLSPGFKFNDWELRGAPLRVEIGPRDLDAGTIVIAQRLGSEAKTQMHLANAVSDLPDMLDNYHQFLLARATAFRDKNTTTVDDWEHFQLAVSTGWARAFLCDDPACEEDIKADTGATPRCVPLDGPTETGECVRCHGRSAYGKRVIFGRAY